ncbi:MAG: IDEAL domain-containing protein [Candidatus Methanofastidiosa archaeon]|jgi:hypothetical protein|nr:IDEAL domain-containing protein [Candidatus Methanofastidiosa archaeon]MDD4281565.1 IDEAL domain-containing protein [Candidatus Methanofastidiosa archaeon]
MSIEDIFGDFSQLQWWIVFAALIVVVYAIKRRKVRRLREEIDEALANGNE